jgi:hypothetical protein
MTRMKRDNTMSIGNIILIAAAVYVAVALLAFIVNANIGPVTPGLALMRAVLWPLWVMGFIPGERMPMD